MIDILADIEQRAQAAIASAATERELRAAEVRFLGRKGELTGVLRSLKEKTEEERGQLGQEANALKQTLADAIAGRQSSLHADVHTGSAADPTVPGTPVVRGHLHPVSIVLGRIWDTFTAMGYEILDGPEVETDEHNFKMLNIPDGHPVRDEQDTYYVGSGEKQQWLLRTQMTTTSISRGLPKRELPAKLIATGKCYRRDAVDATHIPMFHQFDGIVVGKGITMADLKGTLHAAMRRILEAEVDVRFRVSYFPFTEPSAEFDYSCTVCGGKGCSTCKQSGWIEMGGCGMIHPAVLKNVGLDPEEVSGLAFGFGVERPFMIRHRVSDLRLFLENDLRFLSQFSDVSSCP